MLDSLSFCFVKLLNDFTFDKWVRFFFSFFSYFSNLWNTTLQVYVVSVFVFSFGSIFLYFYPILFTCLVFLTMLLRFVYVQRKKAIMQMRIVNFYRTINFSQTQDKSEWWIRCRHYYDAIPMCGMFVLQQNFNFI